MRLRVTGGGRAWWGDALGTDGVSHPCCREGKWLGALTVRVFQQAHSGPEGDRWG